MLCVSSTTVPLSIVLPKYNTIKTFPYLVAHSAALNSCLDKTYSRWVYNLHSPATGVTNIFSINNMFAVYMTHLLYIPYTHKSQYRRVTASAISLCLGSVLTLHTHDVFEDGKTDGWDRYQCSSMVNVLCTTEAEKEQKKVHAIKLKFSTTSAA